MWPSNKPQQTSTSAAETPAALVCLTLRKCKAKGGLAFNGITSIPTYKLRKERLKVNDICMKEEEDKRSYVMQLIKQYQQCQYL
jgi:hypothetical protein